MYRLGTALVSCKEKTKEYQTEKLGRVTTTNYSNAEENVPLYKIAVEIDCEVSWLRKKLKGLGIWRPKTPEETKKETQKNGTNVVNKRLCYGNKDLRTKQSVNN